jgi:hypothetical protein
MSALPGRNFVIDLAGGDFAQAKNDFFVIGLVFDKRLPPFV